GNVSYDGDTFTYIDENGTSQTINFEELVQANETVTTLVNNGDGTYTYTNEAGDTVTIDLAEGPQGPAGAEGKSAYEVWLEKGNTVSEQDFLDSLVGPQVLQGIAGVDEVDGKSAYEVWLEEGNTG